MDVGIKLTNLTNYRTVSYLHTERNVQYMTIYSLEQQIHSEHVNADVTDSTHCTYTVCVTHDTLQI